MSQNAKKKKSTPSPRLSKKDVETLLKIAKKDQEEAKAQAAKLLQDETFVAPKLPDNLQVEVDSLVRTMAEQDAARAEAERDPQFFVPVSACQCRDRPCSCEETKMVTELRRRGYYVAPPLPRPTNVVSDSIFTRYGHEQPPVVSRVSQQRETAQEAVKRIASYKGREDKRPPIPSDAKLLRDMRVRQYEESGFLPLIPQREPPMPVFANWERNLELWPLFTQGGFLPRDFAAKVAKSLARDELRQSLERKARVAKLALRRTWAKLTGEW